MTPRVRAGVIAALSDVTSLAHAGRLTTLLYKGLRRALE